MKPVRGWLYSGYTTLSLALAVFLFRSEEIVSTVEPTKLKWLFQWIEAPGVWTWLFFAFGVAACFFLGMQLRADRKLRSSGRGGQNHGKMKDASGIAWLTVVFFGMLCGGLGVLIGAILWMLLVTRIGVSSVQESMARPRRRS